jgi:hypothetical protein
MRENTVFELAMLVRTMAKGVAGVPSMISIKDMSIGYMYVMSIMADTKVSKPLLIEGYTISAEIDIVATMQGKCTRYIRTVYLGVIAVVLRHRRWVKPAREFSLLYSPGRNTCDSIDYNKWILQTTTIRLFNKKGQLRSVLSILHEHTNIISAKML